MPFVAAHPIEAADDENDVLEDQIPRVDMDEEDGPDDSDITPAAVIADVMGSGKQRRVAKKKDSLGLCSVAAAEDLEWLHDDESESEEETVEPKKSKAKKSKAKVSKS